MVEEVFENLLLLENPGYNAGVNLTPSLSLLSEKPMCVRELIA
jgi:hypothetical protein